MTFTIPNQADAIEDPTDKWPQSEPDSRDFADILAASLSLTGVVSGCVVDQQLVADMTVAVTSGVVIVGGTSATVSAGNVTVGASEAQPRFDLICVSSAGVKSCVAGTAATNPVFPNPSGKAVLAAVYVPASDTDIDANQIIDKRVIIKPWVQLSGDTMTGSLTVQTSASGANLLVTGDTQNSTIRGTAYGDTSATSPLAQLLLRRFRGTVAAPLRTKSGDLMGRMGGTGSHAADDVSAATLLTTASSYLEFRASEAFTSTARGADIRFITTPIGSTTAAEQMRLVSFTGNTYSCLMLDDIQGYVADKSARFAVNMASTNRTAVLDGARGATYTRIARLGSGTAGQGDGAMMAIAAHHTSCSSATITGAANNGSGLIRITTSAAHGFTTGYRVAVNFVGGVTNANNVWTVTVIDTTHFDLQGSTFAGVYTSGGKATSAGSIMGGIFYVTMATPRVLSGGSGNSADADDVTGVVVYNGSSLPTLSGTTSFYQAHNPVYNDTGEYEWASGYDAAGYNQYWAFGGFGFARIGADGAFFDAARCAYDTGATPLKLPKNNYIRFTDSDGTTASVNFAKYDTSAAAITFGAKIQLTDTDIMLSAGTGTKIGTATTEKLAFHNSAPVAQQTVTGSRGSGAALADLLTKLAAKGLIVDGSSA